MKPKFLTIILLCFLKTLTAQDTLQVTTEKGDFTPPQYSTAYDDVFMNKKETKWLLKLNLTPLIHPLQILSLEHKLGKNLSVNYALGALKGKTLISVQPRLYFKNDTQNAVNNLNGSYIGLNAMYALYDLGGEGKKNPNWGLVVNYGLQKRVFNNWYIDYQVGIGMDKFNFNNNNPKTNDSHYWLHNAFTLGLAFGGGKKSTTNTCDLFNCFEEENSLWKFDFRNIYKRVPTLGYEININPEYERKIGQSSFSVNTSINLGYYNYNSADGYGFATALEPRYYYNLKKRIASGKSANNLSGNYISLNISAGYGNFSFMNTSRTFDSTVVQFSKFHGTRYIIEPRWGIQRRLFKNGFVDLSISPIHLEKIFQTNDETKEDGTVINSTTVNRYAVKYFNLTNLNRRISLNQLSKVYFKIGFAF
jgi:Protein of unknown function (DUF3575)